jgi:hypothetical protein
MVAPASVFKDFFCGHNCGCRSNRADVAFTFEAAEFSKIFPGRISAASDFFGMGGLPPGFFLGQTVGFGLRLVVRAEKLRFYNYASTSRSDGTDVQTVAVAGGE